MLAKATFLATMAQIANVDDAALGSVSFTGVVEEGSSLQAVTSITDADGAVSLSYQWQSSSDEVSWTDLSGATASSYTIPSDQSLVGKYIRLSVLSTDTLGGTTTFASNSAQVPDVLNPVANGWIQVGHGVAAFPYYANMSLSGDGTVIAVGGEIQHMGIVRVYRIDSGVWTQVGGDIEGEANGDRLGQSIALSNDGSLVAIGAPRNDGNGVDSGHVRIYRNDSGVWVQVGEDIDGEFAGDHSGESVSLSSDGSVVTIGAPRNDGDGMDSGHVRIYRNESGIWTQVGGDIDGGFAGDHSGESISLSSDGSVVAIGSPGHDRFDKWIKEPVTNPDGTTHWIDVPHYRPDCGRVRIFRNESGVWSQMGGDIDGVARHYRSGVAVSLSDNGWIVAEMNSSNTHGNIVRVFSRANGPALGSVSFTGVVEEGSSLQAVTSITDADGAVSLSYQWQSSSDEVSWTDLSGATASSYTIPSDQSLVGKYIRLSVLSTDTLGGTTTFASNSAQVANVDDAALGNVSFDGVFEEGSVLEAVTNINDPDGSVILSYQWQRSGDGILWMDPAGGDGSR